MYRTKQKKVLSSKDNVAYMFPASKALPPETLGSESYNMNTIRVDFDSSAKRREEKDLLAQLEHGPQRLKNVDQRIAELLKIIEKHQQYLYESNVILNDGTAKVVLPEMVWEEVSIMDAEIQRLTEEYRQLEERKHKLLQETKEESIYMKYMQRLSDDKDLDALADHLENVQCTTGLLNQQTTAIQTMETQTSADLSVAHTQYHLFKSQTNNQMHCLLQESEAHIAHFNSLLEKIDEMKCKIVDIPHKYYITVQAMCKLAGIKERKPLFHTKTLESNLDDIHLFLKEKEFIIKQYKKNRQKPRQDNAPHVPDTN